MRPYVINQYPNQDATVDRLHSLLLDFTAFANAQFRALIAFASEAGLRMLEPSVRRFLDGQHSIFWIVGVDLGGTGRDALKFLLKLKRDYPGQVDVRVFSTMDNRSIFHPKVYWLNAEERQVVLIGSANATTGGFTKNFEVSVQLNVEPIVDEELIEELEFLWMSYSSPLPPLLPENLLEINSALIARFSHDLPPTDGNLQLPHPLRDLRPSPRRPPSKLPTKGRPPGHGRRELIMDILQETRQTQVQLPVGVLTSFFGGRRSIHLRQVRGATIIKVDVRPIIHLGNNTHRIEIDSIRGVPRPQIIRFRRNGRLATVVDYELVLKGTRKYLEFDKLLAQRGHQTRSGARRWLLR